MKTIDKLFIYLLNNVKRRFINLQNRFLSFFSIYLFFCRETMCIVGICSECVSRFQTFKYGRDYCKHAAHAIVRILYKPHVRRFHNIFNWWLLWSCTICVSISTLLSHRYTLGQFGNNVYKRNKRSVHDYCVYQFENRSLITHE